MKKLTPKSWGHNTVPGHHFHKFTIILESGDTIVYHHTNQDSTLIVVKIIIMILKLILMVTLITIITIITKIIVIGSTVINTSAY